MKVKAWLLLTITVSYVITTKAIRTPIYAPLHIISLKDITAEERRQIAYIQQKLDREKRSGSSGSGSGEIINLLKNAIGNGIKKKIGQLTMASAAASGSFSKTSSGGGYHHTEYHHHPPDHYYEEHHHDHHDHSHKSFDFWNLKKSILNTLLQAVKAVKGGVIAIKGQLVKGGGKLISASGHLVSSQGDAITHLGKNIATSAILVPWMGSSGKGHPHVEYESAEHHYSAPSAPSEIYHHSSPSGPSPDYHVPEHYPPPHREGTSGLLILKKVPGHGRDRQEYYSSPVDNHQSSPSFGSVLGKLFSASSSLDPHKPELYGDSPVEHHINSYQADIVDSDHNEIEPSASGIVKHEVSTPVKTKLTKKPTQSHNNFDVDFDETPNTLPSSYKQTKPVELHHGEPFSNLNFKKTPSDFLTSSNEEMSKKPEKININNYPFLKNTDSQGQPSPFQYPEPQNLQYNDFTNLYLSPPSNSQFLAPETDLENNSVIDLTNINNSPLIDSSRPSPYLETPKMPSLNDEFSTDTYDFTQSNTKNPISDTSNYFRNNYNQFSPNFDVVPSVSFELQPQGPKRLT